MSRRDSLLREMGLAPLWKLRSAVEEVAETLPQAPQVDSRQDQAAAMLATPARTEPASDARSEFRRSLSAESPTRPDAVAPPVRVSPNADAASVPPRRASAGVVASELASPALVEAAGLSWQDLQAKVSDCQACVLGKARKQAVFGVGDTHADWLFVGEGPGADEDEKGEPFVGQAGKLLDAMLAAIDLRRGDKVYIANAVKCRPPGNRTPELDETATCFPYLERQIELIQPKLIVALGRPAAQTLLKTEVKIGVARGKLFDYRNIPVIITYHPAYLLRNLTEKAKAWEDLCFARRTMGQILARQG